MYIFVCKNNHSRCVATQRREKKATTGLNKIIKKCPSISSAAAPADKQPTINAAMTRYDKCFHRMTIALRCAVHNRPFASVDDQWYKIELDHLRAGMCT